MSIDPAGSERSALDVLMRVPLQLSAELGRTRMTLAEILNLGKGSVVELDRPAGAAIDVFVEGTPIARGEIVAAGENFGIRVTELAAGAREAPRA
ncbi:MAG: flagellar motor switch protein FliN [Candidatus Tumulicola sp.]